MTSPTQELDINEVTLDETEPFEEGTVVVEAGTVVIDATVPVIIKKSVREKAEREARKAAKIANPATETVAQPKTKGFAMIMPARTENIVVQAMAVPHQAATFLLTLLTPRVITSIGTVEELDVEGETGYQRTLNQKHASEYGSSLIRDAYNRETWIPRTVMMAYDGPGYDAETGTFTITPEEKLELIDGQHFCKAVTLVMQRLNETLDVSQRQLLEATLDDTPIVCQIIINADLEIKRKTFLRMNGLGKMVSGGLLETMQGQMGTFSPDVQAAYQACLLLARDPQSPFHGIVNFKGSPDKIHRLGVRNLRIAITQAAATGMGVTPEELYQGMLDLWNPIKEVFGMDKRLFNTAVFNGIMMTRDLLSKDGAAETLKSKLIDGLDDFKGFSGAGDGARTVASKIRQFLS